MRRPLTLVCLLIGLGVLQTYGLRRMSQAGTRKSEADHPPMPAQVPYRRQDTWYEFVIRQFNPDHVDYGKWVEEQRRNLIEVRFRNRYFLYSVSTTIAFLLAIAICTKQRVDHQRRMWITAEMMTDLYNQDAYSRQVAQEAIERYNRHIERCNRALEGSETSAVASGADIEQLRTELTRVAEQRDLAIRDRDLAREELRQKSEILADMSIRLDAATSSASVAIPSKAMPDLRSADQKVVTHINRLQEQLYVERRRNRKLKGE